MKSYIPIAIDSTTATFEIYPATANTVVTLISLRLSTESTDADIEIQDTDGTNIGGQHHLGKGSGGLHHDTIFLPYDFRGYAVAPAGKGLQIANLDSATIDGLAIVEAEPIN